MATDLSPKNEQFIQQAVACGTFPDRGRALDEAVELLKRRQELLAAGRLLCPKKPGRPAKLLKQPN